MKRFALWPGSLSGRLLLILLLGLVAAHALSFWLVFMERGMATRSMMVSYLARDVASSVAILERVPPAERASWLPRLARHNYRLRLDQRTGGAPSTARLAEPLTRAVAATLEPAREVSALQAREPGMALRLQLRLGDGTPLTIDISEPGLGVSPWVLAVLVAQLAVLALLSWLAVRLATRPLQQLASAADALGPGQQGQLLPEGGPREVAQAAAAFNAMQRRIQAHLAERMHILAAVSHDLQTPMTRLRLRADLLDDAALRDKLLADLDEMQALVQEGITYARTAQAVREEERVVDLQALLESIVSDYTDAGRRVSLMQTDAGAIRSRPQGLRRLLCNLVDNALKFAGPTEIAVLRLPGSIAIRVLDRGPGIPADQLQAVLQPFFRLETSRSRDTGGTGLGLAIAHQLAQALEGQLELAEREGGGLEARLTLPTRS